MAGAETPVCRHFFIYRFILAHGLKPADSAIYGLSQTVNGRYTGESHRNFYERAAQNGFIAMA